MSSKGKVSGHIEKTPKWHGLIWVSFEGTKGLVKRSSLIKLGSSRGLDQKLACHGRQIPHCVVACIWVGRGMTLELRPFLAQFPIDIVRRKNTGPRVRGFLFQLQSFHLLPVWPRAGCFPSLVLIYKVKDGAHSFSSEYGYLESSSPDLNLGFPNY